MNSAKNTMPVLVTLTGCSEEDATTVFQTLRKTFDCDRKDATAWPRGPRPPTVWSSTFEVTSRPVSVVPVRLSSDVKAGLQGGYWAVDRMVETLAAAFEIHNQSTASGDQEKDVQLRLAGAGR